MSPMPLAMSPALSLLAHHDPTAALALATAATERPPVAHCNCCGRDYSALEWRDLPYVGLQDDGDGGWLVLRNCACLSTLAVQS